MDELQSTRLEKARALHERIVNGFTGIRNADAKMRRFLYEFDREGYWNDMGYKNLWGAFEGPLKHAFGVTPSWMYRLIKRATAEDQVGILPPGATGGESTDRSVRKHVANLNLPGTALDQLAKLNNQPEDQKKAFEKAKLRAGNNPINEKLVKDAVKPFLAPKSRLDPKPKGGQREPFKRITMAERSFNIVRDLKHVIEECKGLKADPDAVSHLQIALDILGPWKEQHQ